jgi:hypothetical protein
MAGASLSVLRQFVPSREAEERCDLCGMALADDHMHNFDPASRRIRCACESCAALYERVYRPIPRRVQLLSDFQLSDGQWDDLMIPISLAFFSYSTPVSKWIALYPGPAGATESLLSLDLWEEIIAANPALGRLEPDVEALMVNRVGAAREYFIVPIDDCYRLVGLIRLHWRGLSGGAVVWGEIGKFFSNLQQKGSHARSDV